MTQEHILNKLYDILQARKNTDGETSYVASLYEKGSPKIAEKILEEAQEFIDEAFHIHHDRADENTQKNIRSEAADLLFHIMVMLSHHDVPPGDVFEILEGRFGTSGHDEKASRRK
ncbi:MAG: phosphoribosyl-ATP diphosphatase [Alphaproteobacteria bacterium]